MMRNLEIPLSRLLIGFGLVFLLGILFAIVNGYYVQQSDEVLPFIVYGISLVSLLTGGVLILLFQWRISTHQLRSLLSLLESDEQKIVEVLLDNNRKLEQNKLVVLTGVSKVRISRVLTRMQQRGVIEKKPLGNTNLIVLRL